MKEKVKTTLWFLLSILLIVLVYNLNKEDIAYTSITSRFNIEAKKLNKTVYKDYEGAELYEDGIVKGVDSYYKVYEVDKGKLALYSDKKSLELILNDINPIIEAPLIGKNNEILCVLQERGMSIKNVKPTMPVKIINDLVGGNLIERLSAFNLEEVEDTKIVRFTDSKVDGIYIKADGNEYIVPMLSDKKCAELGVDNYSLNVLDDFIVKIRK